MGGCMFSFAPVDKVDQIVNSLNELPVKVYQTNMTARGVEIVS
jgi:hypothetical protein